MYNCTDCGENFNIPRKIKEDESDTKAISRIYFVCPKCSSENIKEREIKYCKCCGRPIGNKKENYCSVSCRKQGEKLFEQQRQKYIHIKNSPIYKTARMLEDYNKSHNTNLSYGQFTATVLPILLKEEKKNGRKNKIS